MLFPTEDEARDYAKVRGDCEVSQSPDGDGWIVKYVEPTSAILDNGARKSKGNNQKSEFLTLSGSITVTICLLFQAMAWLGGQYSISAWIGWCIPLILTFVCAPMLFHKQSNTMSDVYAIALAIAYLVEISSASVLLDLFVRHSASATPIGAISEIGLRMAGNLGGMFPVLIAGIIVARALLLKRGQQPNA